jgi:hypothetical protein
LARKSLQQWGDKKTQVIGGLPTRQQALPLNTTLAA